jgi:hypothetical protein
MKNKLPYAFIGAWFSVGGFSSHVAAIVGGVLLSLAILLGMISAVQGGCRRQGAAIVAIAVFLYVGSIAHYLFMAGAESEIAQLLINMANAPAELPQRAIDHRWAAFAYLLSFGGIMIGGAVVLGGPKAWHSWLTSR